LHIPPKARFDDDHCIQFRARGVRPNLAAGYRARKECLKPGFEARDGHAVVMKSNQNGANNSRAHFRRRSIWNTILNAPMIADPLGRSIVAV